MRTMQMSFHAMEMWEYVPRTRFNSFMKYRRNKKNIDALLGRDLTGFVLLIAMVLILACCTWCTCAYAEEDILYVCVDENSYLNGRAKPNKHSEVTMKLYSGDNVEVVNVRNDGWVEIVGGETGTSFVDARYLSNAYESFTATNISGGRVKVRSSIGGEVVGYVKAGKTVKVERSMNGWGYIGSGWVMLEYFD